MAAAAKRLACLDRPSQISASSLGARNRQRRAVGRSSWRCAEQRSYAAGVALARRRRRAPGDEAGLLVDAFVEERVGVGVVDVQYGAGREHVARDARARREADLRYLVLRARPREPMGTRLTTEHMSKNEQQTAPRTASSCVLLLLLLLLLLLFPCLRCNEKVEAQCCSR